MSSLNRGPPREKSWNVSRITQIPEYLSWILLLMYYKPLWNGEAASISVCFRNLSPLVKKVYEDRGGGWGCRGWGWGVPGRAGEVLDWVCASPPPPAAYGGRGDLRGSVAASFAHIPLSGLCSPVPTLFLFHLVSAPERGSWGMRRDPEGIATQGSFSPFVQALCQVWRPRAPAHPRLL